MTIKEIQELIRIINKSSLSELKLKDGEFELSIRTEKYHSARKEASSPVVLPQQPLVSMPPQMPTPPPAVPVAPSAPAPKAVASTEQSEKAETNTSYLEIKSPMVGTFYRSQSPDKPPYVKVGDVVESGETVCMIEAMKLFNEIESEIRGKIVKVMVEDAQPVEYDQVLFLVEPA